MYKNIGIVIATKKYSSNLNKTIKSIFAQSYLPTEFIIVSGKKIKKIFMNKSKFNLKIVNSKIKNQVYQRNIGIKLLSKKIDIILQLDDRVILHKNCLKELINCWNKSKKNITGIGINQISNNHNLGFMNKISRIFGLNGKVFSFGVNFDYSNLKNDLDVMWLKGGLSSWCLKKNSRIKNRSFPLWNWCVNEDVDYSLGKKKNEKLLVCYKAKAKLLDQKKISYFEYLNRGKLYTISKKMIINKFFNNSLLSIFGFVILVILANLKAIFSFNLSNIYFNLGRFLGLFKKSITK